MQTTILPKAVLYRLSDPIGRGEDIREVRDKEYRAKGKKPRGKSKGGRRHLS